MPAASEAAWSVTGAVNRTSRPAAARAALDALAPVRVDLAREVDLPAHGRIVVGAAGHVRFRRRPVTSSGELSVAYTLPDDVDRRPVLIDGSGTLGRRIACAFAAGGTDVRIYDVSAEQREAARTYVEEHLADTQRALGLTPDRTGTVEAVDDLAAAASGAWMIVESITERVDLKVEVFGELDRLADADAILCTNSSSLPSSLLIGKVARPERVLNTHFQQPPELNAVELMSCGADRRRRSSMRSWPSSRSTGLVPFRVLKESDGFIFNRVWAAVKRECLMVLDEGVADARGVDEMWRIFTSAGVRPSG